MFILKNNEKYYELAVIFEKLEAEEDGLALFRPVTVSLGKFNEDDLTFTDCHGKKFNHMCITNDREFGFGLRTSLDVIKEIYGCKVFKNNVRKFFSELKNDMFYFGADATKRDNIYLVGEDFKSHDRSFYEDKDIMQFLSFEDEAKGEPFVRKDINTKNLINTVKSRVVGQNDAIDDIVTVLWQNSHSNVKRNILLVGPTGVGKTEIIKTISRELDVPLVIASSSGLTKSGYKGEGVDDILRRLYHKAGGNISKVENGIVILDEFDKLACHERSEDTISTSGVQEELLKFTEGCEYDLDISDNPMVEDFVSINTEGITFIAMGAFANLDKQNKTNESNGIGFCSVVKEKKDEKAFYKEIDPKSLQKYGIIPELVGRFPIIIPLNPASEEMMMQVINLNLFDEKIELLGSQGIKLKINNPEVVKQKIAHLALEKNIGVRGLNSVVEKTFIKAMREISQSDGEFSELIIDENTIDDPKKYVLTKKN